MVDVRQVTIARLGAHGDGVADVDGAEMFIPFSLPGETWLVAAGREAERLDSAAARRVPICRHFGRCGGCAMQHVEATAYADWKRNLVVNALARHGITVPVGPLVAVPLASRRRAVLTARSVSPNCVVGYYEAGAHTLIDLEECPILEPEIVAAVPDLRDLTRLVANSEEPVRFTVLASDTGLDITAEGAVHAPDASRRAALATLCARAGWARLTVQGEEIVSRHRPEIDVHGARITVPAGTFVQAVAAAEQAMQAKIVAAAGSAKTVADLFCGVGTLTFPLALKARVYAVDNDAAALDALAHAARNAQGFKPIETRRRDLLREPLARKELEPFDCVVFDPPRAGAQAQAEKLAQSKVPVVVAVSCNPATLARDLSHLVAGGYRIEEITPIDQFRFSPHVEVVAHLRRPKRRR